MSKIKDTYKAIALEYIQTNDIREAYKKYHPEVSEASLQVLPYNLLENIRFKAIKEELCKKIEPDLEANAKQCLQTLFELSQIAKKESDRILASTNYLKLTIGEISKVKDISSAQEDEFNSLRRDIFLTTDWQ